RSIHAPGAGQPALVAAAAIVVAAALAAAAGARGDLVGAQTLGQAHLVGVAVVARGAGPHACLLAGHAAPCLADRLTLRLGVARHRHVLAIGIAGDREEVAAVHLDAGRLLGTAAAPAPLDGALALPSRRDHALLVDAMREIADPLAPYAAVGAPQALVPDLGLASGQREQRKQRQSEGARCG